jgi:hypothetical protein
LSPRENEDRVKANWTVVGTVAARQVGRLCFESTTRILNHFLTTARKGDRVASARAASYIESESI